MTLGGYICGVAVLALALTSCGGERDLGPAAASATATATATPAYRHTAGGYRVVGTPLVLAKDGSTHLDVIVRLNKRLRTDRGDTEGFAAMFVVDGTALHAPPGRIGRPARLCYSGPIGPEGLPESLEHPRPGQGVLLEIKLPGVKRAIRIPAELRVTLPEEQLALIEALCGSIDA